MVQLRAMRELLVLVGKRRGAFEGVVPRVGHGRRRHNFECVLGDSKLSSDSAVLATCQACVLLNEIGVVLAAVLQVGTSVQSTDGSSLCVNSSM